MKKSIFVASVLSKLDLPRTALETDIKKHNRFAKSRSELSEVSLPGFENVLWHFANVPVSGDIEIVFANKWNNRIRTIDVPITTGFLATCLQSKDGYRKLLFGASLS